tara:strand:- start:381 stop:1271 length:891 start_codon:yes stop_codon:yes gene_type:complete
MKYYPIIIFCFNRPNHLKKLLGSIYKNKDYNKHKYFFFCDHFKNLKDKSDNLKVIKIINKLKKFKKSKIIVRTKNFGLSKNIILGVNQVLKNNDASIILEDDLVLNEHVLKFLNTALNIYSNNKTIYSVSAYSYLKGHSLTFKDNIFKTNRHSSWGWGTWKKKWEKINFYDTKFFKNADKNFSKLGNDMNLMMWAQNNSIIDSWAIRFNYFCYSKNLLSIQPKHSMIKNIGNDLSGHHRSLRFNFNNHFKKDFNPSLKINASQNKIKNSYQINQYIKKIHRPSLKLLTMYLLRKII